MSNHKDMVNKQEEQLMAEMPEHLGALSKLALLRTVQYLLGNNYPTCKAEWAMIHMHHHRMVTFVQDLLEEGHYSKFPF